MELVHRPELDEYREATIALAEQTKCEGNCDQHSGAVQCVRVFDGKDGFDWGYFSYCKTARDEDRSRGFTFIYVGA